MSATALFIGIANVNADTRMAANAIVAIFDVYIK
jgi:hypothetical protein